MESGVGGDKKSHWNPNLKRYETARTSGKEILPTKFRLKRDFHFRDSVPKPRPSSLLLCDTQWLTVGSQSTRRVSFRRQGPRPRPVFLFRGLRISVNRSLSVPLRPTLYYYRTRTKPSIGSYPRLPPVPKNRRSDVVIPLLNGRESRPYPIPFPSRTMVIVQERGDWFKILKRTYLQKSKRHKGNFVKVSGIYKIKTLTVVKTTPHLVRQ